MRLRDTASRLPFPAEPPRHWPSPALAFAECAVAAWPVVTVSLTVMPAGTERAPARPHPSQHSPHPCLSLLSYGEIQDLRSLATDVLGSTRIGLPTRSRR